MGGWGLGRGSWFSHSSLWLSRNCAQVTGEGLSQPSYPSPAANNTASYSVLKWVSCPSPCESQALLFISVGFWIWKVSCPHPSSDLVQAFYSILPPAPHQDKPSFPWAGTGDLTISYPSLKNRWLLFHVIQCPVQGVEYLLPFPQQQLTDCSYQRGSRALQVLCLSTIAGDRHLTLMQGSECGWNTCSTLKTL